MWFKFKRLSSTVHQAFTRLSMGQNQQEQYLFFCLLRNTNVFNQCIDISVDLINCIQTHLRSQHPRPFSFWLSASISAQNQSGHLDRSQSTPSLHKKLLWRGRSEAEHMHYTVSFTPRLWNPTHVNNSFCPRSTAHLPGFASVKLLKCWIQPQMLQLGSHHLLSQAQQTYYVILACSLTVVREDFCHTISYFSLLPHGCRNNNDMDLNVVCLPCSKRAQFLSL